MNSVFHRNSVDFVLGFVNRVAPGCVADVSEGHANSTCHTPCSPLLLGSDSPFSPSQWACGNTYLYNLTTFAPYRPRPQGVSSKFLRRVGNTVHNHTAQNAQDMMMMMMMMRYSYPASRNSTWGPSSLLPYGYRRLPKH